MPSPGPDIQFFQLLLDTCYGISEIAYQLGFSDLAGHQWELSYMDEGQMRA